MNRLFASFGLAIFVAACSSLSKPSSLEQLGDAIRAHETGQTDKGAGETWRMAAKYLQDANVAFDKRDVEEADRLSQIGVLLARTASVMDREVVIRMDIEQASAQEASLLFEIELFSSKIGQMEKTIEREKLRVHLETVVADTQRRAAAAEELQEKGLSPEDRKIIEGARELVGKEMVAKATLGLSLAQMYVDADLIIPERLGELSGAVALAGKSLKDKELANVQKYVEIALVEISQLNEDALLPIDTSTETVRFSMQSDDPPLEPVAEEFGFAVSVPTKKGQPSKTGKNVLDRIATFLSAHKEFRGLVAVSADGKSAGQSTQRKAQQIGALLLDAGAPSGQISWIGFGEASPLVSLRSKGMRVSVLVVELVH